MTIALINGSPKKNKSSSGIVLDLIKGFLAEDDNIIEFNLNRPDVDLNIIKNIANANTIVFAFPLYVDGIPSHLLYWLYELKQYLKANPNPDLYIYGVVNCGFYEGKQGSIALEILNNWCIKAGLGWGQGLSIGCGGMLSMLRNSPNGAGPWKSLLETLNSFVNNIQTRSHDDNIFVQANIPRIAYKIGGNAGWRKQIKANGLSVKDLHRRVN